MTIIRTTNYDTANELLARINAELAQAARDNLMSGNVHAEEIYCGVLNIVLDCNLVNVNRARRNAPGIDLIDTERRLIVQVTSDWSSKKMSATLASPAIAAYAEEGYTLKFCYIGEQKDATKRRNPSNPHGIAFSAKDDVILTKDILREFVFRSVEDQERLIGLLKKEIGDGCLITDAFVRERLDTAISALGPRYTPEANVDTPDMEALLAFTGSTIFRRRFEAACDSLRSAIARFSEIEFEWHRERAAAQGAIESISPLAQALVDETAARGTAKWGKLVAGVARAASDCTTYPLCLLQSGKDVDGINRKYDDVRRRHNSLCSICNTYRADLLGGVWLLVTGEGGIGKSHLLADAACRALENGCIPILVLGSWFNGPCESLDRIPSLLGFTCSLDEFLDEFSRYSSVRGATGLLIIDALNEGNGRAFWKTSLDWLVDRVAARENLRLIVSVRSTYRRDVVPPSLEAQGPPEHECLGFRDAEALDIESYCEYYGIARPVAPLIGSEFSNPLHLRLLCEHLARRGGGDISAGVSLPPAIESYLWGINDGLSTSLGYDPSVNLVSRVVDAIIGSGELRYGGIGYELAVDIAAGVADYFVSNPGNMIRALVSVGLFNEYGGGDWRHLVFAYELVGNYATAMHVIRRAEKDAGVADVSRRRNALKVVLEDTNLMASRDSGVLAALSAIMPERWGVELFEVLPEGERDLLVCRAFVESLGWRRTVSATPQLEAFLRAGVFSHEETLGLFVDKSYQVGVREGNGLNALFLQSLLLPMKMSERDRFWSTKVASSASARALGIWTWNHAESLKLRAADLTARMLVLATGTLNPETRKNSIKALARLLMTQPRLAATLYADFRVVDDDYMFEGLLAVLYGAMVNAPNSDDEAWQGIAQLVCEDVFEAEETYPNAVVRDFARLIAEASRDERLMQAAQPPYWSKWYDVLPSNEEIDSVVEAVAQRYGEWSVEHLSTKSIVDSMTTEYGRGTGWYGDFGRYVFGHAVRPWENQFNEQDLSNAVVSGILQDWYCPEVHAAYDRAAMHETGGPIGSRERIGKKYQVIGLHRLIARLLDNHPPFKIENVHREGYEEALAAYSEHCSQMIKRGDFRSLGLESFDRKEWVIGKERVPYTAEALDSISMSLRWIDPTEVWKTGDLSEAPSWNPLCVDDELDEWVGRNDECNQLGELRTVECSIGRAYTLASRREWVHEVDGYRSRVACWLSAAYMISAADFEEVSQAYSAFNHAAYMGDHYGDVFLGELYEGYGYRADAALYESEKDEIELKICKTTYEHSSGEIGVDDECSTMFAPSQELVDCLGLHHVGAGIWQNPEGATVAINVSGNGEGSEGLLFNADVLDAYLDSTGLILCWDEYFEKETGQRLYRCWQFVRQDGSGYDTHIRERYCRETDIFNTRFETWAD